MKLYIGNLTYAIADTELREIFEKFGEVTSVELIKDKYTGRSKGFGFVEMTNSEEAEAAIAELNESDLKGRTVRVNEARPKTERPPR